MLQNAVFNIAIASHRQAMTASQHPLKPPLRPQN